MAEPLQLKLQFCGACGFSKYAKALICALEDEFGDSVEVELIQDKGATGNFELSVADSGELLHSKKAGKGRCETEEETEEVISKIKEIKEDK